MSAHSFHAIGRQVVGERRDGSEVERSTFDVASARTLRDQLDRAITQAEAEAARP